MLTTRRVEKRFATLLFSLCASVVLLQSGVYSQGIQDNLWITDGSVSAVATSGNTIYIGGQFTYVGPATGNGAGINTSTGEPDLTLPKVLGTIYAVALDGSGGWYVGGSFTKVGGAVRNNIAHIKSDKSLDMSWNPNANNNVKSIAVSGSTVYAGGNFTNIGGQTRNRIAALDATTGNATSWNPNSNGTVEAIVVSGSTVYVGGSISSIGGQARTSIAALDASTGLATSWTPNANFTVYSLAISGNTVYAGGVFTIIGGQSRNRLAALDATTGNATSWNPNPSPQVIVPTVNALAVSGSTVYVGGYFNSIGGQTRNHLAAIDVVTGNATSWDPNPGPGTLTVTGLVVSGSTVYACGGFTSIGGQPRKYIAALDSATGNATSWNPNPNNFVRAIAVSGSTLYAGGDFISVGVLPRVKIAAFDATTGLATSWNPTANGDVDAIVVSSSTVIVGGSFTTIGGQTRSNIAALDSTTGLATSWSPNANSTVYALSISGSLVYAGGQFTFIGGQARNRIVALDATTGNATGWNPNCNYLVTNLAVSGSTVYAGGYFTSIGGQTRNNLAALDSTTGSATSWNPNPDAGISALLVSGSTVYTGGGFTSIGGQVRNSIAALDAGTGLATSWNPNANSSPFALALSGSTMYVAGGFTSIGGQSRNRIAAIDVTTGLATSWNPNANSNVIALAVLGSRVYAGGSFTDIFSSAHSYFAGITDPSSIPMSYTSSTVTQNTANLYPNSTNQQIIGIRVDMTGSLSPMAITSLAVNTNGTTSTADISNLKIFSTGTSSTFATTTQYGVTVASPSGPVAVTGSQTLSTGTNYFWLTYDIPAGATSGNAVDAECNSITGSGSMGTQTPSPQAPAGSRTIVGAMSGTYTIGLSLFNSVTGRNLTHVKRTRKVLIPLSIELQTDLQSHKLSQPEKPTYKSEDVVAEGNAREKSSMIEMGEEYSVLIENGKPYVGDQFAPVSKEEGTKLGLTDSPQGVYTTITAAVADLNLRGVSGPVNFSLVDATYPSETLPITISPFAGASATNTLTIKPASGITSTISGSSTTSIFKLNGADYVIIDGSNTNGGTTRDLTISNTSTGSNTAAIWISSLGAGAGATNNTIKNCNLAAGTNAVSSTFGLHVGGTTISSGGSGADNDNLTIQNNSITKAYYGIYASAPFANMNDLMTISQNSIGSSTAANQIGYAGMYILNLNTSAIDLNTVFNIVGTVHDPVGILLSQVTATAVRRNDVHSIRYTGTGGYGGHGVVLEITTNLLFANNIIYDILGDGWYQFGSDAIFGIKATGSTNLQLYYNSVILSGSISRASATNDVSAALYLDSGVSGADIRDNIFVNSIENTTGVAKAYAIYSDAASGSFTDINYNNYYTSGLEGVLGFLSSDRPTLAGWQTATTKDAQSVSANPGFTSATNLHVDPANANSWNVNGRGVAIASVATDIDGDARSTTPGTPTDIGADEFTSAVEPPAATASGPPAFSTTTTYTSAERQVVAITWPTSLSPSSTLPTAVSVKYFPGVPPPGAGGTNINSYWDITATGGSGYTYSINLYYTDAEKNGINHLDMAIGKRDPTQPWVNVGGTPSVPSSDRYVFVSGLTSFSQFTITDINAPLPIQLASFTATEVPNRGVQLRWTTLSETNNYGFYAQRRRQNETAWTELPNSFIAGNGTTNEPHNYTFRDSSASSGSWSYRLKQVDLNGTVHYTDAIQVSVVTDVRETAPIEFSLKQNYPNPFNPSTTIRFSVEKTDRATVDIYNLLGQKVGVLFDDIAQAGQYYKIRFDATKLASGTYIYRLESSKQSTLKKLLLLK